MFVNVLDMLFGCWHRNYSFPMKKKGSREETYVVCLDCGKEFAYDWNKMKVLSPVPESPEPATLTTAPVASGLGKAA